MLRTKSAQLRFVVPGLAIIVALFSALAVGAPSVQQVSGTMSHKASVTISGSGFGSKGTAAPVIWDDASGSNILSKWSGAWPDNNPTYNTTYRSPQRGVGLPHGNITRYIAGAHAESAGATGGYNVIVYKTISVPSYPAYFYASWYQTVDPAWVFQSNSNFKTFAYSVGGGPYQMPNNWYTEINNSTFTSATTTFDLKWHINDDATPTSNATLISPDANGHGWWWSPILNPIAAGWVKQEIAVKLTSQNDGYVKQWENGSLVADYRGPTDKYPGYTSLPATRTIGIGGYSNMYGQPSNWRYFADVYFDTSLSRVVLANDSNLSNATIIETQVPRNWSASSIDVTVNLGKFREGQTAYLFVVDSSGQASSAGYPIVVGASGVSAPPEPQPNPPSGVTVE